MADGIQMIDILKDAARKMGTKAFEELLIVEEKSGALSGALKHLQTGRRAFDDSSERILASLGIANKEDLDQISHKMGKLRKRLDSILDRLDELTESGEE